MKLEVTDFVIEVTRRCNMTCAHCLRGDQQNVDMPLEIIDSIFAGLTRIRTLTFTGGEPSLAVLQMNRALDAARRSGVEVNQVYIVTNGKQVSDEFLRICREWHIYCLDSAWNLPDVLDADTLLRAARLMGAGNDVDEERCGVWVALSIDRFHEPIERRNLLKLFTLPRFVNDKFRNDTSDKWVISEGRAADNDLGYEDGKQMRPWEYNDQALELEVSTDAERTMGFIEQLYVSYNGTIVKGCDYPYAKQEDYTLGKIEPQAHDRLDDTWQDRLVKPFLDPEEDEK